MNFLHPYIRYGAAIVIVNNNLKSVQEIIDNPTMLVKELELCLGDFRMKPETAFSGMEKVKFTYFKEKKGNPNAGVFLSPNVISSDKAAGNIFKAAEDLIEKIKKEPFKKEDVTMSIAPVAGEYLRFGDKETGRGKPKITNLEAALCMITSMTRWKPSLAYKKIAGGKVERKNVAILPDLRLDEMTAFIQIYKRVVSSGTGDKDLGMLEGMVFRETNEKGELKAEKPSRPRIYDGNFPYAPRSSGLSKVGLLGAIGHWAEKEAKYFDEAIKVINSLNDTQLYMVGYGSAETFRYNHYVVELAMKNKLKSIVDSIYYAELYDKGWRNQSNKLDYQEFDLFTGRFLHIFNRYAFKDFLAFRAEYPWQVETLFNVYFEKMEKIPLEIVSSARALGNWLNYATYVAAKEDIKSNEVKNKKVVEGSKDYYRLIAKKKSNFLVELESSAFTARKGADLLFQVIRRAGLLSHTDAPSEANLFMEKTCSEPTFLNEAKNMLIAFSRVKNTLQKNEVPHKVGDTFFETEETQGEDNSEA